MIDVHAPNLDAYYRTHLPDVVPGDYTFRLSLKRAGLPAVPLDHAVTELDWDDEETALTGAVTLQRPIPDDPLSLPIIRGDLVSCMVEWGRQHHYKLWTMRCKPPTTALETGVVTVDLEDDLILLRRQKLDWIFRKTRRHPHGYNARQITRLVANRLGLKVGELAPADEKFSLVLRNSTAMDALTKAWAHEKQKNGQHYVIRLRNGKLEVVPIRRNPVLYVLADEIQTAAMTERAGSRQPTTVLEGYAKLGKGKDAKKIRYTHVDRAVASKYGYVHEKKHYGTVNSRLELRRKVKRDLAERLKWNDAITIQHAGIPFILRGDGIKLHRPQEGYSGPQAFVFCTRGSHTVTTTYTSEFDFVLKDPYLKQSPAAKAGRSGGGTHDSSGGAPVTG